MISARHAERNTQMYKTTLNGITLFCSYDTVIGYSSSYNRARLANSWGPTTGRHMNEHGIRDYPEVAENEMENMIRDDFNRIALEDIKSRVKGSRHAK